MRDNRDYGREWRIVGEAENYEENGNCLRSTKLWERMENCKRRWRTVGEAGNCGRSSER